VAQIPVREMYPGLDRIHPSTVATAWNGRHLLTPIYDAEGYAAGEGFRLYELPATITSSEVLERAAVGR
jgi:hypothetical protein